MLVKHTQKRIFRVFFDLISELFADFLAFSHLCFVVLVLLHQARIQHQKLGRNTYSKIFFYKALCWGMSSLIESVA